MFVAKFPSGWVFPGIFGRRFGFSGKRPLRLRGSYVFSALIVLVVVLRPRPFFRVRAKLPSACLLHSSLFHPANRLDTQPRTKDEDEDD
jgi:hypothetical protein